MNEKAEHILHRYFPELGSEALGKLYQLEQIYCEWNKKINVISRKDINNLMLHHVLHSLALLRFDNIRSGTHVLDIGTGGGFPGIPLAICNPDVQFTLVDGRNKKIVVVNEVVAALQLKNVRALNIRSEEIKEKFNVVTGRSITEFSEFRKMARFNLIKDGAIYYWTGGEYSQLISYPSVTLIKLSDLFQEDYFIDKYIIKANLP